jgi:hypothetical protein
MPISVKPSPPPVLALVRGGLVVVVALGVERIKVAHVLGLTGGGVVRGSPSDTFGPGRVLGGVSLAAVDDDLLDLGQAITLCRQLLEVEPVAL